MASNTAEEYQSGNVLFLILIAVALFAALSYAVTSSSRGGGSDVSKEKIATFAAQLVQNTTLIQSSIMRSMVSDNVPEYGFDFSSQSTEPLTNATCTTNKCRLFQDKGGKIYPELIPQWASTSPLVGYKKPRFRITQVSNVGSSKDDVVLVYISLQRQVCETLNKELGIQDIDLNDTTELYSGFLPYSGTLTSLPDNTGSVLGDQLASLSGKKSYCFQHSTEGYTYVHVVMVR